MCCCTHSEREQQRNDQVEQEREQQPGGDQGEEYEHSQEGAEQEELKVEDFPSYEAYVEAATKLREKQEETERLEDERNRAQQEQEDRIQAERESKSLRQFSQLRSLIIGPHHVKILPRQQ